MKICNIAIICIIFLHGYAYSDTVYRCGNTYSQTPCSTNATTIELKSTTGVDCSKILNWQKCKPSKESKSKATTTPEWLPIMPIQEFSIDAIKEKLSSYPWATPFPKHREFLPINYQGINQEKALNLIRNKIQKPNREEFEKTIEYQQRLKRDIIDLFPLSSKIEYAIRLGAEPKYNADTEQYFFYNIISCEFPYFTREILFCRAGNNKSENFTFAMTNPHNFLRVNGVTETSPYSTSPIYIEYSVDMPIKNAKFISDYNINALLVGTFTFGGFYNGKNFIMSNGEYGHDALPFQPTRLIIFVSNTGEILSQEIFPVDNQ